MISAILLAAGKSSRMFGENKLSKEFKNLPLIKHSVKNLLASSVDELIVVLGHQTKIIEKIIGKNKKLKVFFNKDFESGMASSIKVGINSLSKNNKFFFICLGDMPLVSKNIYNELIKFKNINDIIVPTYNGKQGNPILFSQKMKKKITNIKGDVGAKNILELNKDKIFKVKINNKSIITDFNTPDNFII